MKISLNRVFWILFQLKGALILIPKSLLSDFRHKMAQQERSFPPLSLLHEKLLPFLPTLVQQPMPKQCSS